jgi:rRNA maturation RNase YbeY
MSIVVRNRQRVRRVSTPLLRRIVTATLTELLAVNESDICIHLVAAPEMARVNKQFLQHEGSTDVITFNLSFGVPPSGGSDRVNAELRTLHGEIFICLDDAVAQAKQFRTTWQSEVIRYAIHGILHLLGHDDLKPLARKKMKREENRLVRALSKQFPLARLAR